jgi:hypothetical protein
MGLNTKHPGGYNGFNRVPDFSGAGGVWNMKMVQVEVGYKEWPELVLWENNPSSPLSDWTVNGPSVNNSIGFPTPPSIAITGNSQYAHIEPVPGENLFYKTIAFRCYITSGAINLHFHNSTNGQGPFIKLDSRGGTNYTGIMYANSWGSYTKQPIYGPYIAPNTWVAVKLRLYASSRCGWFTSGQFRDIFPFQSLGNRIGVSSFNGGTGYIDNLEIYRGVP